MAGLKKILNAERSISQPNNYPSEHTSTPEPETWRPESYTMSHTGNDDNDYPSDPALPRLSQMHNRTFQGIEKQFEELHDQFQTRPSRSLSSKSRRYKHVGSKPTPLRNKRHIDVLQAIFSHHKHRPIVATPVTPTTYFYNEDIADRNLRLPMSVGIDGSSPFSCVLSSVYQEDVAERNLQVNGCNIGPRRDPVAKYNSKARRTGRRGNFGPRLANDHLAPRSKSEMATHSLAYEETAPSDLRVISSAQDLRANPEMSPQQQWQHAGADRHHLPQQLGKNLPLRSQNSTPALPPTSVDDCHGGLQPMRANSRQQQMSRKGTPSPLGGTINDPASLTGIRNLSVPVSKGGTASHALSGKSINRLQSAGPMKSIVRKNIHDLTIDTTLAAPRKTFVKVPPRQAEPKAPTPKKDAPPSIAEIVNSPVSAATSTRPSPSYNVEEIMNLFKKAYNSSQSASPHPTFESLQDAIIREINSHDAFRQIHSDSSGLSVAPGLSPDLTSDEFYETQFLRRMNNKSSPPYHQYQNQQRPVSRNKLQPKQPKKSSMRRQRRNSETLGRELSFPALKGEEDSTEQWHYLSRSKNKKRRHTYGHAYASNSIHDYDEYGSPAEEEEVPRIPKRTPDATTRNGNDIVSASPSPRPDHSAKSAPHRSRSSQALSSETASSVLDPTSLQPKRPQSLNLLRQPSRPNLPTKQKAATSAAGRGSQQHQPPSVAEIPGQQQHQHQYQRPDKRTVSATSAPSDPRHRPVRAALAPASSANARKRIPLRRSSIQKDMYDSGRFRM